MYCTVTDIKDSLPEEELIELTDEKGIGLIDQGKVDRAIKSADALIDGFCGTKYSVPFSSTPDLINTLSVDLSIYYLYKQSPISEIPDKVNDAKKDAFKKLESISKGVISLGLDPAPAAPSEGGASASKTESDRVFTRDSLKGF